MGDPGGIGPEVILKTIHEFGTAKATPLLLGNSSVFKFYADSIGFDLDIHIVENASDVVPGQINLIESAAMDPEIRPGRLEAVNGKAAMQSVAKGIEACLSSSADALVTAPISKEAITRAGYRVPGHTEFLAEKTGTDQVLMMLVSGPLRVALATIHVPLRDVAGLLTPELLTTRLQILHNSLRTDFNIPEPKIAVFGLNPHSGDGGVIGREEIDLITPVIEKLNHSGYSLSGPFAGDGFFGKQMQNKYDAIFAMYHDQGLIPFKALTFGKGVNFTAGLPIIRTSPDHGTAFDIAGTNSADHRSFLSAYSLAIEMAQHRKKVATD